MSAGFVCKPTEPRRHGFTLVELLVVIGIIALLAALLTPAVMRSLTKARNSAIKNEVDLLHMALMNYQSEYGAFPPCADPLFTSGSYTNGGPSAKHLRRLFPRCADAAFQLNNTNKPGSPVRMSPTSSPILWLSGFTTNPVSPLVPGPARVKLFEFDKARITAEPVTYYPSGSKGSPYVYFDSASYGTPQSPNTFTDDASNVYSPETAVFTSGTEFFNATTFQILCAGRDGKWGSDDDVSNFWQGTRREYQDRLKN
ncbi:MAG: type II secretion system protein [Sphaerospermopsis kisseleviana]